MPKPEPLVSRDLRPGVAERMGAAVDVVGALDEASVRALSSRLREAEVESVAVIYLHALYGHSHRHLAVELLTCRPTVSGPSPDVPLRLLATGGAELAPKGRRPVFFPELDGDADTPVFDRHRLAPGTILAGPVIIEERECTIVAGPSATVRVDPFGMLFLELSHANGGTF